MRSPRICIHVVRLFLHSHKQGLTGVDAFLYRIGTAPHNGSYVPVEGGYPVSRAFPFRSADVLVSAEFGKFNQILRREFSLLPTLGTLLHRHDLIGPCAFLHVPLHVYVCYFKVGSTLPGDRASMPRRYPTHRTCFSTSSSPIDQRRIDAFVGGNARRRSRVDLRPGPVGGQRRQRFS